MAIAFRFNAARRWAALGISALVPFGLADAAQAQARHRQCGAPVLSAAEKERVEAGTRARMFALDVSAARAAGTVTIPVWFHVVRQGSGLANGDVPTSMLNDQIQVMNDAFSGVTGGANTPFRFQLAGVKRRLEPSVFTGCESDSVKAQLHSGRVGGAETLNIYLCRPASFFGWAYFPWWYSSSPSTDGLVLHFGTLPGSTWEPFNRGDTAVHEAGHWLGLYHTFEGGCSSANDQVSDTPAEAMAHYGCPASLDSCPSLAGLDPIRNFMSYFDDDCIWEFTSGQTSRMDTQHATYRFSGTTPRATPTPTPRVTPTPTPTLTPTPTPGGTAAYVWREAESGTVSAPMRKVNDTSASGGVHIAVAPGTSTAGSPPSNGQGVISFSVPRAGTYKVWGRVIAATDADDSFWVRVDGGTWTNWNNIPTGSSWHWDDVHNGASGNTLVTYNLAAGNHTLTIAYREDGARLDKVLITNDSAFVPSGAGN
jgi:hypothetical protein